MLYKVTLDFRLFMKFNSLVLITIFLDNFRLCNRINLVQTIFRKHTSCLRRLEKNITAEKLLSMSLKTNDSEGFIGAP